MTTAVVGHGLHADHDHKLAQTDNEKRRQILKGAREVFLSKGFDGASMDQIAKEAGVSKGTLYVYFASKEVLFEALILEERMSLAENFIDLSLCDEEPRIALQRIGEKFVKKMVSPAHIQSVRMVIGATEKFPQFGRIFYQAGPAVGLSRTAAYLGALGERGVLDVPDPEIAACHFLSLLNSDVLKRALFGMEHDCSPERIRQITEQAVTVFMRAYAPQSR
jgi:AcrR family transcriptional regulator